MVESETCESSLWAERCGWYLWACPLQCSQGQLSGFDWNFKLVQCLAWFMFIRQQKVPYNGAKMSQWPTSLFPFSFQSTYPGQILFQFLSNSTEFLFQRIPTLCKQNPSNLGGEGCTFSSGVAPQFFVRLLHTKTDYLSGGPAFVFAMREKTSWLSKAIFIQTFRSVLASGGHRYAIKIYDKEIYYWHGPTSHTASYFFLTSVAGMGSDLDETEPTQGDS